MKPTLDINMLMVVYQTPWFFSTSSGVGLHFFFIASLRLRVFWRRLDEDSGQASIEEFGFAPQGRNGRAAKMRLEKMAERKVTVEYEMVMILVFTSSWCNLEEVRFMAHSRIFM